MNARRHHSSPTETSHTDGGRRPDDREQPPIERLLEVVTDPARRQILETLRSGTDGQVIDSLLDVNGAEDTERSRSEHRAMLYHHQLPKLEDVGLVEIDWERKLIYYRPDARVEILLDTVSTLSTEWESIEQPRASTRTRDIAARVCRTLESLR